jgi:hypothetical protein
MVTVAVVALVVVIVICVGYRVRTVRRSVDEKLEVLSGNLDSRVILLIGSGDQIRNRTRVGGILRSVSRRKVAVDTGGQVVFVATHSIRTLQDDGGNPIGEW